MKNHCAEDTNPLLKICRDNKLEDQSRFNNLCTYVLSQKTNAQFWCKILMDIQPLIFKKDFELNLAALAPFY
jgi:hypothetical protein